MLERVHFYLRDVLGYAYDEVIAVLVPPLSTLADLAERVDAVHYVRPTEDFEPLAASFKRIKNILKQAGLEKSSRPLGKMLTPGPEQQLYDAYLSARENAEKIQLLPGQAVHDCIASAAGGSVLR